MSLRAIASGGGSETGPRPAIASCSDGALAPWGLARLNHGLEFEGRKLPPGKVSWQNEVRLRFALKGVRPGQLQAMCAQVGLQVVSIRRLRIGRVSLAKMPVGAWRYLPVGERF